MVFRGIWGYLGRGVGEISSVKYSKLRPLLVFFFFFSLFPQFSFLLIFLGRTAFFFARQLAALSAYFY